jgi:hypothetical protein
LTMGAAYRGFGQINKVEESADGTIHVFGIASTADRDSVGEIVTSDAMKAALPDYQRFPALREMHQPSAAGRVTEAYVDDDGATQIVAHVVDPIAISKVRAGVYAGFSIGGKVTARDPQDRTIIKGIRLTEISLVDVPCQPNATLNMWKAEAMSSNPTSDEVVAKAKDMAQDAGRKSFKDFLFKARESLIADADALAKAEDDLVDEPVAEIEPAIETPVIEKADAVDPVTALDAALAKAVAGITAAPVAVPAIDLAKTASALRVLAAKAETDLAKGMYACQRLADIIDCASNLQISTAYEAEHEGDNSPVPAEMAAAVAALCAVLVHMVAEETAEIVACYQADGMDIDFDPSSDDYDGDDMAMARSIVDLAKSDTDLMAKAGARHSKTDATTIQSMHDSAMALGATCDAGNVANADDTKEETGDSKKLDAMAAENERLAKALAEAAPQVDHITKAFSDTVNGLRGTITDLTKRLEQVEASPAAAKTATTLVPITKGQDATGAAHADTHTLSGDEFRKAFESLPDDEKGRYLIKVAHLNPVAAHIGR